MKFNLNSFLENKIVLYVIFFLSLATVFGYIVLNNYAAVLFFILLAFLTNYFSKNMIVILGSAILGTHLLAVLNIFDNNREGFKEGNVNSAGSGLDGSGNAHSTDAGGGLDGNGNAHSTGAGGSRDGSGNSMKNNNTRKTEESDASESGDSFVNMGADPKLRSTDIVPNVDNILSKDDKAKATEKAHDLLESTFGEENIRNMSLDTKELINRQKELMEEMKKITPILSQTMGMVGNIDLGGLTNMFDKVTSMMPKQNAE